MSRIEAGPSGAGQQRLDPRVAGQFGRRGVGLALRIGREIAGNVARGKSRKAEQADAEMREILADTAAGGEDVVDRGVHIRRAAVIAELIADALRPRGKFGAVELPIGYFANVIDIGATGLAICTDGVGSKAIIAQLMSCYDTIGIDCIAMNVNDLICVGALPVSLVDYIAVERVDAQMLDAIAIGLADGAAQAGISISGGETAQLEDVVRGFDLAGTAVGTVALEVSPCRLRRPS